MNLNRLTQVSLGLMMGTATFFTSCSQDADNVFNESTTNAVHFTANITGQTETKASKAIEDGRKLSVAAFSNNALIESKNYTTSSGNLSPADGSEMTVPTGKYKFCSVGINAANEDFIDVSNGSISTTLKNGTDYIWASSGDITTSDNGTSKNVPFEFSHVCANVKLILTPESGVTISNPSLEWTPSDVNGASWDLQTGVITANSLSSTKVPISNPSIDSSNGVLTAQMIMLPLSNQQSGKIEVDIKLTLNSETASRNYTLSLPLKDNNLEAGKSYSYYAAIKNNEIVFNNVTIKDWVDVNYNDSNNPIIPGQTK